MEVPWDDKHQSRTLLLWQLRSHGNQSETSISPYLTEFMFGMEVSWDNRHQLHTLVAMATKVRPQ